MVPKADLDEAQEKYNALFAKVLAGEYSANGGTPPEKSDEEKTKEFQKLMRDFAEHKIHRPVEHISGLLKLDEYLTSKGNRSIFEATEGDRNYNGAYEESMRVRDLLKKALDECKGDDGVLMANIQAGLKDNIR